MNSKIESNISTELDAAFSALARYDSGGKRSELLPIDSAVVQSLKNESLRLNIEIRLTSVLSNGAPGAARQYACTKLALIGTSTCVREVAKLLTDSKVATDARNVLENMPDDAASKALLAALAKASGLERAGIIRSLAVRRYTPAIKALRVEAQSADPDVRLAAANAIQILEATKKS